MARRVGMNSSDTAQAIRHHAVSLFARHGYEAVSMRQIASAVGVMPGALYHHFATKQDLLMCLMDEHMQRLHHSWQSHCAHHHFDRLDAAQKLDCFVQFHIRYHIALPDDVFLSFMELRSLKTEHFKIIEQARKAYEQVVKDILLQGQNTKQMRVEDTHVTAMALLGMLTGLQYWFSQSGRLSEDEIVRSYSRLAMQMVGITADRPSYPFQFTPVTSGDKSCLILS